MANERFFLNFISDESGIVYIDEPVGFNSVSFDFMQKPNGYGRDITFNGGEVEFTFVNYRNHYLDRLLYYFHHYGFESKVQFGVEFTDSSVIVGDLDFAKATTDDLEYFKCKVIQVSEVQIVKRRKDTKVDLFATKDIDGNAITPIVTHDVLLTPKEVLGVSRWEQSESFNQDLWAKDISPKTTYLRINPCVNLKQYDLANSYTFFEIKEGYSVGLVNPVTGIVEETNEPGFLLLEAKDSIVNVNISIKDMVLDFERYASGGGSGYVDAKFVLCYGSDWNTATEQILINEHLTSSNPTYTFTGGFNLNIESLKRGDKVWIYFDFKIRKSNTTGSGGKLGLHTQISGMKTDITGSSKTYYSTVKGIRLIDAMKQVVKSISGLNIDAPRFDVGGEFYDTFIYNGNLLRKKTDVPFQISLDDIQKSISETNCDYEVADTVFFGVEDDFYKPFECWFFNTVQFSEFSKTHNERFSINEFLFKYKNYQSKKENEVLNTDDTVHGECTYTFFNKMVENKKEVNIEWIRDTFLIEQAKQKALEITKDTASQNDTDIFAIDMIANTEDSTFNETTLLYHEYNPDTEILSLRTKDVPNFLSLGLSVGSKFSILSGSNNTGIYTVFKVSENELQLEVAYTNPPPPFPALPMAFPTVNNNGEYLTSYQYTLSAADYPFKNRTSEEMSNFSNLNSPETYSNLRYSIGRNIYNYFSSYLATCNQFWKEKGLTNTWYKNNKECTFTYQEKTLTEGADFYPEGQILSPFMYDNITFANIDFQDYMALQESIKTNRGFIRTIDKNGNVIKVYPKKMSYENLSKELNIVGEEKFESAYLDISTAGDIITLNNGEYKLKKLDWEIKEHKLYVYDANRQRLYNGIFWDKVSINGFNPESEEKLSELMNLVL